MRRDWIAVYGSVLTNRKYRRLSVAGKAGLFHVWLLAITTNPEATWGSTDELREYLELDGLPGDVLDELIAGRWLDVEADGTVTVHEWDHHQLAASRAIRDAFEAHRKRKWRRDRKTEPDLTGTSPNQDLTLPNKGPDDVRTVSGRTPNPEWKKDFEREEWTAFLEEWHTRFQYPPSGSEDEPKSQRAILWPIVRDYPTQSVEWLRSAPRHLTAFDLVGHIHREWKRERLVA